MVFIALIIRGFQVLNFLLVHWVSKFIWLGIMICIARC